MDDTKKNAKEASTTFSDHQRDLDNAMNERIKEETGSDKLDSLDVNNPVRRGNKTDVSKKKAGGGKQSSPGD